MKQEEIIKQMTDDELKKQLFFSQGLFFLISMLLSFLFFSRITDWFLYIQFNSKQILYYGFFLGTLIVIFELALFYIIPKKYFDDGGINERIFRNQSLGTIFLIALVVAISEEFLFRGVLQTTFGYFFASSLFVVVHIRYLKKPVLLALIIFISFFIGYLFEITGNLLVTIAFHFTVDFLLGIFIKHDK